MTGMDSGLLIFGVIRSRSHLPDQDGPCQEVVDVAILNYRENKLSEEVRWNMIVWPRKEADHLDEGSVE